jgi:hypothetical protein
MTALAFITAFGWVTTIKFEQGAILVISYLSNKKTYVVYMKLVLLSVV